jgi:hypothetical protein
MDSESITKKGGELVICEACRREFLGAMFSRLMPNDLRILQYLRKEQVTEPQVGRTQVELWTVLQTHMGFQACRECLLGLYRCGLVGRSHLGKKDGFYLTPDGEKILQL